MKLSNIISTGLAAFASAAFLPRQFNRSIENIKDKLSDGTRAPVVEGNSLINLSNTTASDVIDEECDDRFDPMAAFIAGHLQSLGLDQHEFNEVVDDLLDITWSLRSSDLTERQYQRLAREQIEEVRLERFETMQREVAKEMHFTDEKYFRSL